MHAVHSVSRASARPGPRYAALHAARNARGSHGDWAHDAPHASAGRLLPPAPDVWHAALSTHAGRSLVWVPLSFGRKLYFGGSPFDPVE